MEKNENQILAEVGKPMPKMVEMPSQNYPQAPEQIYQMGQPVGSSNPNNVGIAQGYYNLSGPNAQAQYGVGEQLVEIGVPYPFKVWPKIPTQINCHLCKKNGMTFFEWRRNKQWLYGSFCCLLFGIIPGIIIFF